MIKVPTYCCGKGCDKEIEIEISESIYNDPFLRQVEMENALCTECNNRFDDYLKKYYVSEDQLTYRKYIQNLIDDSEIMTNYLPYDHNHPKANHALYNFTSRHSGAGLWISGATGQGKTRIVQDVALKLIRERREKVFFSSAPKLLDRISAIHAENAEKGTRYLEKLYSYDLLIIDDLGKENMNPTKKTRLWQLIDERYTRFDRRAPGWKLWITTNDDGTGLLSAMGNDGIPAIRRIQDICMIWPPQLQNQGK